LIHFLEFDMSIFNQRIAVIGNAVDGLKFAGPFDFVQDAQRYMEQSGEPWQIAELQSPAPEVEDLPPEAWHEGLTLTPVGVTDNGIDGSDHYVLVKRVDGEELSVRLAQDFVLSRMGLACRGPGTMFCDLVTGFKIGSPLDTVLCKAYYRFDI
jgi:hypothetical protein